MSTTPKLEQAVEGPLHGALQELTALGQALGYPITEEDAQFLTNRTLRGFSKTSPHLPSMLVDVSVRAGRGLAFIEFVPIGPERIAPRGGGHRWHLSKVGQEARCPNATVSAPVTGVFDHVSDRPLQHGNGVRVTQHDPSAESAEKRSLLRGIAREIRSRNVGIQCCAY